jgi:hypothetical protein
MSNKHETALALIDDQIEKEEKNLEEAKIKVDIAQEQLKSAESEKKLIEWSLDQIKASRGALIFDRTANSITEEPSEVP